MDHVGQIAQHDIIVVWPCMQESFPVRNLQAFIKFGFKCLNYIGNCISIQLWNPGTNGIVF